MRTRWWFTLVAVLLCGAAGSPQDGPSETPGCRCVLDGAPGARLLARPVSKIGIHWVDVRVKSERGFLEVLFRVKPELVLLGDRAPRETFAARSDPPVVGLKASWLKAQDDVEHRHARVAFALAHLYAHVLQDKRGCPLPERSRELHADLLAGWYLGKRNLGTIGDDAILDASYAAALFARPDEYRNERWEHGEPAMRARAVATGFRLRRDEKLSLKEIYARGLELYPPPNVGVVGAPADAAVPRAAPGQRLVKVACGHEGPCRHQVRCVHQKPCTHFVACTHMEECTHLVARTVQVPCVHRMPCVHRVDCEHKVPCVHTIPCTHKEHPFDFLPDGSRCECTHYVHDFDYLHNFDYAHDFDYAHEYDYQHDFDEEQRMEPKHPEGHPIHEFDLAHKWDPVHEFDLAHPSDPVHDYDVRVEPAAPK